MAPAPADRPSSTSSPTLVMPFMATPLLLIAGVVLVEVSASYPTMLAGAQGLMVGSSSPLEGVVAPSPVEPTELRTSVSVALLPPTVDAMDMSDAKTRFHPPCNFTLGHFDPACARFVRFKEARTAPSGLGDRFVQFLIPYLFALEADAVPMPVQDELFDAKGWHGDYAWAKDFFNFGAPLPFPNASSAMAAYPNMEVVRPAAHGNFQARVDSVKGKCNVTIETNMDVCEGLCYLASKPNFQRIRHVLACNVLHSKARANLPPLAFDNTTDEYVVTIHVRRGDITLHGDGPDAEAYFTKLKAQIDEVLQDFPAVHYYFITEGPELQANQAPLAFLPSIFRDEDRTKTTYLNHLDPQASLLHMMNADMLVTTGSSFPFIATVVSPKPVILFGRPKEEHFYPAYLRDDFILVDDDGSILSPTLGEASALVAIRYEEVHGRPFPYTRRLRPEDGRLSTGSK